MTVTATCAAAPIARATLIKFEAGMLIRPVIAERLRAMFEGRGAVFAEDGQGITWTARLDR